MIPLDNGILVVESCDDIVIRFNGDPYRGVLRSGGGHFGYKSAKCWILENVSFPSPPPQTPPIPSVLTPDPRRTEPHPPLPPPHPPGDFPPSPWVVGRVGGAAGRPGGKCTVRLNTCEIRCCFPSNLCKTYWKRRLPSCHDTLPRALRNCLGYGNLGNRPEWSHDVNLGRQR